MPLRYKQVVWVLRQLSRLPHGRGVRQLVGSAALMQGVAQFVAVSGYSGLGSSLASLHIAYGIGLVLISLALLLTRNALAYTLYGRLSAALLAGLYASIAVDVLPSLASASMATLLGLCMLAEATTIKRWPPP